MIRHNGKKIKDRIRVLVDWVMEISLWLVLFTLPFSKSMVEVFFGIALSAWLMKRVLNCRRGDSLIGIFKPARTELNVPIIAFFFVVFLSTLTSVSLCLSIKGLMFKLFERVMIYFIVVEKCSSRKELNRVFIVLLSSMVFITIDGIYQFITGVDFIRQYPGGENMILGCFDNRNDFAGWLVMVIPVALSLAWFWKDDWFDFSTGFRWVKKLLRPFLWVLTAFLVICLGLTCSRGAWAAITLSVIFMGIFRSRKLLIVTIVMLLLLPFTAPKFVRERVSLFMKPGNTTISTRERLWTEALSIIRDYPVLGCGPNTYAAVGPGYKTSKTEPDFYPHNSYLHMAAETGLLGLGAFTWLIFMLFRVSLRGLGKIKTGIYGAFLTGLLTGLFGFLMHSFVDTNIYSLQLGVLMWFVMGLVIAVQRMAAGDRGTGG